MANVLNRQTKLYLESVNTPDYPDTEWVVDPDLSAVEGQPIQYWVINSDDSITLIDEAAQAEADRFLPYLGKSVEDAIQTKIDEINAYREVKLNGTWVFSGVRYDSDVVSRSNMTGIMTLVGTGYTLPESFTFRSHDNTDIHYNNATFTTFYQCSCVWAEMIYRTSWYHKARVHAMTSIQDVATYDYTAGWPEGYSGEN